MILLRCRNSSTRKIRCCPRWFNKIASAGANVLICQKGIDDVVQVYLAKKGILALRRAKESDMTKLAKATGARLVTNLDDLSAKDLGMSTDLWKKEN